MTMHIDRFRHIKAAEARNRLQEKMRRDEIGLRAATALMWFSEYADRPDVDKVINARTSLVASSTPGVNEAHHYVKHAAEEHLRLILERAVQMAQEDLAEVEKSK